MVQELGFLQQALEAPWFVGYVGARASSGRGWWIRQRWDESVQTGADRGAGEQLLFVSDLVIRGWKGSESRELLPLKNKFPLGGLA